MEIRACECIQLILSRLKDRGSGSSGHGLSGHLFIGSVGDLAIGDLRFSESAICFRFSPETADNRFGGVSRRGPGEAPSPSALSSVLTRRNQQENVGTTPAVMATIRPGACWSRRNLTIFSAPEGR